MLAKFSSLVLVHDFLGVAVLGSVLAENITKSAAEAQDTVYLKKRACLVAFGKSVGTRRAQPRDSFTFDSSEVPNVLRRESRTWPM